jgi:hypothetical protein
MQRLSRAVAHGADDVIVETRLDLAVIDDGVSPRIQFDPFRQEFRAHTATFTRYGIDHEF